MPAFRYGDRQGTVVTRWKLTWRERLQVLFGGSVWLTMLTFNCALQPVIIASQCPILGIQPCEREPEAA